MDVMRCDAMQWRVDVGKSGGGWFEQARKFHEASPSQYTKAEAKRGGLSKMIGQFVYLQGLKSRSGAETGGGRCEWREGEASMQQLRKLQGNLGGKGGERGNENEGGGSE